MTQFNIFDQIRKNETYEPRRVGNNVTYDTKANAHEEIQSKKALRYSQIIEILKDYNGKPLTAKEIAIEMMYRGYTRNDDRNNASPRLTELGERGIVEPIGKKKCEFTGKMVSVWALRSE